MLHCHSWIIYISSVCKVFTLFKRGDITERVRTAFRIGIVHAHESKSRIIIFLIVQYKVNAVILVGQITGRKPAGSLSKRYSPDSLALTPSFVPGIITLAPGRIFFSESIIFPCREFFWTWAFEEHMAKTEKRTISICFISLSNYFLKFRGRM